MNDLYKLALSFWQGQPYLGVGLTFLVFWLANKLYQKCQFHPLLHPVLTSIIVIIAVLLFIQVDYATYFNGGQLIHFFLGPATVALAWPLYQHFEAIKKIGWSVLSAVLLGILTGATAAVYLAQWLGASTLTQLSLAPKSVTTPVAIAVVEKIGGNSALTAGFVIITGILGAMFGPAIFKLLSIEDDRVKGIAMGVSAHGVGTAKAWQLNHTMGAFSGLAMAMAALMIAFVLPPWLQLLGIF
ncbi:MAG: LrgB family protein [Marinicella sp.]|nr:LrgB family protein [Xanthomonadales bacterium]